MSAMNCMGSYEIAHSIRSVIHAHYQEAPVCGQGFEYVGPGMVPSLCLMNYLGRLLR